MEKAKENAKRKNKYMGIYYNSPFATTIRNLLNQKEFNQEIIAKELKITRQTISLYASGNSLPDINKFKQIITFFKNNGYDYSSDYWLGFISEKSTNLEIKAINKQYGLNEKSLIALEEQNQLKKDFKYPRIDTINYLLEDLLVNKQNSILNVLTDYLFFYSIQNGIEIPIKRTRDISMIEKLTVDSDTAVKSILIKEIETKLDWMKSQIKEEVNKNERKRKSKK